MVMHKTNIILAFIVILMSLLLANVAAADVKIFIKEYSYMASDIDSKVSSRAIALEQVKRSLLEQLGTYLTSETEIKNYQMNKDQISTFTAGIVRAEVVEEKWDGRTYYLKARISVDPKEVAKSVDALRNDVLKSKELADAKKKTEAAMREVERLKAELELAKGDTNKREEYSNAIKNLSAKDWFMKAYAFHGSKDFKNAIDAYTKAIELNPIDALAYINRGTVYYELKRYQHALGDFNKTIELDPNYAAAYFKRAGAYWELGNYQPILNDYNKAIELDPLFAGAYLGRGLAHADLGNYRQAVTDYSMAIELHLIHAEIYYNRGIAYDTLKDYQQALSDYNKAIELDPNYKMAFNNRGVVYTKLGSYQNALNDYNKAIELDPVYAEAYNNRGLIYGYLGNADMAVQNLKMAAKLGYTEAQKRLSKAGIKWQ